MKTNTAPLAFVYDGRACLGFVLSRGRAGFEAFDREERSLGLYPRPHPRRRMRCALLPRTKGLRAEDFCDTKNAPHEAGQI